MALRTISICAGVGGLDLGVRIARPDASCVLYLEREASAAASLVASMEAGRLHPAAIWSDLRTFDAGEWRGAVDCVLSGDPCQGNSVAGKRLGELDDRWLLDRAIEVFDESGAHTFFRENVTGNLAGQLAVAIPALEQLGCRVAAGVFSAAEVGGLHDRERLFILAHTGSARLARRQWVSDDAGEAGTRRSRASGSAAKRGPDERGSAHPFHPQPRLGRTADDVADRPQRIFHCGNGAVPLTAALAWVRLHGLLADGAAGSAFAAADDRTASAGKVAVRAVS